MSRCTGTKLNRFETVSQYSKVCLFDFENFTISSSCKLVNYCMFGECNVLANALESVFMFDENAELIVSYI